MRLFYRRGDEFSSRNRFLPGGGRKNWRCKKGRGDFRHEHVFINVFERVLRCLWVKSDPTPAPGEKRAEKTVCRADTKSPAGAGPRARLVLRVQHVGQCGSPACVVTLPVGGFTNHVHTAATAWPLRIGRFLSYSSISRRLMTTGKSPVRGSVGP